MGDVAMKIHSRDWQVMEEIGDVKILGMVFGIDLRLLCATHMVFGLRGWLEPGGTRFPNLLNVVLVIQGG